MASSFSSSLQLVLCLAVTCTYAQSVKNCPAPGLCYTVALPPSFSGAASGQGSLFNGDIYFQISGPATSSWIALGQGDGMKGSNIFVVYADGDGKNVTLSPRLGTGHVQPQQSNASMATLLEGSGITGGSITANVKCQSCTSWAGGSMDLNSTASKWIWATKSGPAMNNDAPSAIIQRHDATGSFNLDLTKAVASDSSYNPFYQGAALSIPPPASNLTNSSITSFSQQETGPDNSGIAAILHGVVMFLVFVIALPAGAIFIRLFSVKNAIWFHATFQGLAQLASIFGLALGIYVALKTDQMDQPHAIIGLVVVLLLCAQPVLGYLHHLDYKRQQRRTAFTIAHVWYGRILLTAALVNGFLGLRLSGQDIGLQVAYIIIAGWSWILWVVAIVWQAMRKKPLNDGGRSIRMSHMMEDQNHFYHNSGMSHPGMPQQNYR